MTNYLEFEKPLAEMYSKAEELRSLARDDKDLNVDDEIRSLEIKADKLLKSLYGNLTAWRKCQVARHPDRPHCKDYIENLFEEYIPLAGDRNFADDHAVMGGLARFGEHSLIVIGHEKGSDTKSRIERNFGMARPEGYRKAIRLMDLAHRFNLPVLTLVDTPGAYPGKGAEERGQSEAIARSTQKCLKIGVPLISVIIGEGGSGGALAIGVCDHLTMLEYSIYSVISPEGCASILWKSPENANLAAEAMCITADNLQKLKLIDELILEPLGGAHRNAAQVSKDISLSISKNLDIYFNMDLKTLINNRKNKLSSVGYYQD